VDQGDDECKKVVKPTRKYKKEKGEEKERTAVVESKGEEEGGGGRGLVSVDKAVRTHTVTLSSGDTSGAYVSPNNPILAPFI
jgi:hypothetical protein